MIPRTKVNYGLLDLARALLVSETGNAQRDALLKSLSAFLGQDRLALTPSGRGALYVILRASDKPDVVVPAYTCKAVVESATMAGKNVRYVDCAPGSFNLDPDALGALVDDRCVVIATHQFGFPCDVDRIVTICQQRGACVVEDAAAALGSRVGDRPAGTIGNAGFFSFDSTKLVTVPMKGGLIVARDPVWFGRIEQEIRRQYLPMPPAHKVKLLVRAAILVLLEDPILYRLFHKLMFEWRHRFTTDGPGLDLRMNPFYQYRFAEWQASIVRPQINRLPAIVRHRQALFSRLLEGLRDCHSFSLPPSDRLSESACIRFPIRVQGDKIGFYDRAVRRGIDFAFSFTFLANPGRLPIADAHAASVLDLPYYSKLSECELRAVINALRDVDQDLCREQ